MADTSTIKISGIDISEEELAPTELPSTTTLESSQQGLSVVPEIQQSQNTTEIDDESEQQEGKQEGKQEEQGKFIPTIRTEEGYKTVTGTVVETVQESKFLEALQSYFKIKTKYEDAYQKKKNKIINNTNISNQEKREKIQQIKTNCILCKKPVGTIFSYRNKHYKAICGSNESPCKLNIDLEAGNVVNINDTLEFVNNIYQEEINSLIKLKLDLLFNFTDEEATIKKFKELNDSLKSNNKILKHYRDMKDDIINNIEKQERIADIENSLEVLLTDLKQNISQYKSEGKLTVLKDAMETNVNKILPMLKEKNKLEYIYQKMEFNGTDSTYHLIQNKFLHNKLEDVVQPSKIITNKH